MIGGQFIKYNLEECGFTAAVGPDNTNAFTLVDAERNVRKDILMSIMDGYVSEVEQFNKLPSGTDDENKIKFRQLYQKSAQF